MKTSLMRSSLNFLAILLLSTGFISCKDAEKEETEEIVATAEVETADPFFKLSLAQWSLNKPIFEGTLDPKDFAEKASEMGFDGIEYVSQFYAPAIDNAEDPEAAFQDLLDTLKTRSERYDVENVLIMVDNEGDLASSDVEERNQAVENHKRWVDAADFLGAHSIRVNLFGSDDPEIWKENAVAGLTQLADYADDKGVNVIVENHGGFSSNAALLTEVMEEANRENIGTLPDFGNFCVKREGGERWEAECVEEYPKYQGVKEMMPYAKGVSAKSYDFNEEGEETSLDYARLLQIVKDAGFDGYVGVEYEGQRLSPEEGIMATKELLIEEGSELN